MVKKNTRRLKKSIQPFSLIMVFFLIVLLLFVGLVKIFSQPNIQNTHENGVSREEFIAELAPKAQELQAEYGVFASIILGQAALESDFGVSQLSAKYNNLFGIKGSGPNSVYLTTSEFEDGEWIEIAASFRVYDSWGDSLTDHTKLLVNGVTWDTELYQPVIEAENYQEAAKALQQAGYATDPTYAEKVINVIESYELYQYD